jgi:hypothetical protein
MNELTEFDCPSCALRMTVAPLEGAFQVTCPSCFQRLLLAPGQAPTIPADFSRYIDLPEPIIVSTQVAGPARSKRFVRRVNRQAYVEANREAIRRRRWRLLTLSASGIAGMVAIGLLATGAYSYLAEVPEEKWAEIVPGMESPSKLLREFTNVSEALLETFGEIEDTSSRDRAIGRLEMMSARFRGIAQRATALAPLSAAQLGKLDPAYREEVARLSQQANAAAKELQGRRQLLSGQFIAALHEVTTAMDAAAESIRTGWQPAPPATGPAIAELVPIAP